MYYEYIRTNKHKDKNFTYNECINISDHKRTNKQKRLTKDSVAHQLKEIFFEIIFRSCPLTSVEVDVVFQPWRLIELQNTMDIGETQSQFQVQL